MKITNTTETQNAVLPEFGLVLSVLSKHSQLLIAIANSFFVFCGTILALATTTSKISFVIQATGDRKDLAVVMIFALALLTLAGLAVLAFKFHFLEKTFSQLRKYPLLTQTLFVIFALLCAGLLVGNFYELAYYQVEDLRETLCWWYHLPYAYGLVAEQFPYTPPQWIFSIILFYPVAIFYLYFPLLFADMIKSLAATLTKGEKRFLFYGSVISVIYVIALYNLSNLYWLPIYKDTDIGIPWNVFYQYDTGYNAIFDTSATPLYYNNVAIIRHPLFSIFSTPIGVMGRTISTRTLFYSIAIKSIQMIALLCAIIMLSRLVPATNSKQKYLFMLLFSLSFPVLVGSVPLEQVVVPLLFLVFGIHECLNGKSSALWVNGVMGSNMIHFPAVLLYIKSRKTFIKDLLLGGCSFLLLLLTTGQMVFYISLLKVHSAVSHFSTYYSWHERLCYYMAFVHSCVFVPYSEVSASANSARIIIKPSAFDSVDVLGVLLFFVTIYGFIRNYKNKFAQISFVWVGLSFMLMGAGAWAIGEKDTVLYSLHFSWAYISLIYLAIEKTFRDKAKTVILALLAVILLIINGTAAVNILRFGMEYYPVTWQYY